MASTSLALLYDIHVLRESSVNTSPFNRKSWLASRLFKATSRLPGIWGTDANSSFEEGFGFDGSSIRGWQAINASDMLLLPDATSAFIDPFRTHT
ncbi:MAG: glutamine synthetase, partial [Nitrospirae bacterium]|nr:glutamine synthetase [Nitrospirota bacterium]